ncbi:MAG: GGIII-like transmembrane region-containing protein, partial [Candidatus Heimdallarchaeota archaeon]
NTRTLEAEITNQSFTFDSNPDPYSGSLLPDSAFPFPDTREVRVAIYNEPNTTAPAYDASGGDINNNVTGLVDILSVNERFIITVLHAPDILNHMLTTANFDVFIMPDNLPRENIVNMVMDFWLAGGGILSFDGSASLLNHLGILPPEAIGTDGYTVYWDYDGYGFNITTRHPIAKAYPIDHHIGGTFYNYFAWDWASLSGSAVAADLTIVAHSPTDPNYVTALAFDPTDRGGKVVTISHDLVNEILPGINPMILDSVDWLAPRPKGRIAFDLSHQPRLSIDDWDLNSLWPGYYYGMRDYLVSLGYTFDKLYPAAIGDNFTMDRLEPYDMLIINTPDFNYTIGDQVAMETYVANGGSLLAMGDRPDGVWFDKPNEITSTLLAPFGLSLHPTYGVGGTITHTDFNIHPTTEGTDLGLSFSVYGYINVTGPAYPIWQEGANIVVAGSEFGEGRVILTSDINWLQSTGGNIDLVSNKEYVRNVANWLTSTRANVLVYTDWNVVPNFYRTPLALALNDLGVKYYLTSGYSSLRFDYWNLSLNLYPWDLVIVDNPSYSGVQFYFDEIIEYIDTGGHFLMSYYNVDSYQSHQLWAYLGFAYNGQISSDPPVHIWNTGHDIFTQPATYGANNFTVFTSKADDGDTLTVFGNATALAGLTATEQPDEALIVLRNDERTLFNSYLIDEFSGDLDDSTYADNFELWKNEIAFMLRPKLEFLPDFPVTKTIDTTQPYRIEIPNLGLSDATIGLIEIILPLGFATTADDLVQPFNVTRGEVSLVTWNVLFDTIGNYTLTFDAIYQGFIGTIYGTGAFIIDVTVTEATLLPDYVWYILGGVLGALLILIIVVVIVRKRKSRIATR